MRLTSFEITPSFHRDLSAIKLALGIAMPLIFFAGRLAGIAPTEIVEFPERVGWQNKVPNWEGDEVDQHPEDVDESVCSDDDQYTRKTQDQGE